MLDFKLTADGDLDINKSGDISITESVCQAVRVRLLWVLGEWRLIPSLGFPYFEEVLVKNPSQTKIEHLIRKTVMSVDSVTDVKNIDFSLDSKTRVVRIAVTFCVGEETFREEVENKWLSTV